MSLRSSVAKADGLPSEPLDESSSNTKKRLIQEIRPQAPLGKRKGLFFMALLALQYGMQPILSRKCVGKDIIITTQVLGCEIVKVICAAFIMIAEGSLVSMFSNWTFFGMLMSSALPAGIYTLQNFLIQVAYRHLDYLTFSMLNQTKLLFTAFFNYVILGSKQSAKQCFALFVMLIAATLLTLGQGGSKSGSGSLDLDPEIIFVKGIIPVMVASILSGLASTICQFVAQVNKRSPYLMTIEMSLIGSATLFSSMYRSNDGEQIRKYGFFHGWTLVSAVPVVTNALGGILVGLVTKYSGGVKKGFVIISALLVTAVAQFVIDGVPPSPLVLVSFPLVVFATYFHSMYPYVPKEKKTA